MHAPAQYLGSQLSHAVVLDGPTWQVSVGQEGKLVDGSRTCPRKNSMFSIALHVMSKPSAGSTCSISPIDRRTNILRVSQGYSDEARTIENQRSVDIGTSGLIFKVH